MVFEGKLHAEYQLVFPGLLHVSLVKITPPNFMTWFDKLQNTWWKRLLIVLLLPLWLPCVVIDGFILMAFLCTIGNLITYILHGKAEFDI